MIKSFADNPGMLDLTNKEIIFQKVLSIVAMHSKNPV